MSSFTNLSISCSQPWQGIQALSICLYAQLGRAGEAISGVCGGETVEKSGLEWGNFPYCLVFHNTSKAPQYFPFDLFCYIVFRIGSTQINSEDLDHTGAFGDWPEDFATVALDSESWYLDAVHTTLL